MDARGLLESPCQVEAGIQRSWQIWGRGGRLLEAQSSPCPLPGDSPSPRPRELPLGHLVQASGLKMQVPLANPPVCPWPGGRMGEYQQNRACHPWGACSLAGGEGYMQAWNRPLGAPQRWPEAKGGQSWSHSACDAHSVPGTGGNVVTTCKISIHLEHSTWKSLCSGHGSHGCGTLGGVFLGRRLELGLEEGALHVSTCTELL